MLKHGFLLDTCVISELIKPSPSSNVVRWVDGQDEDGFYVSVITLGEIEKGISKLPEGKKKERLQAWLYSELTDRFNDRILDVSLDVAHTWGRILGEAEKHGRSLPVIDALLAATAITKGLTVVTRNTDDMKESGAALLDPWEEESAEGGVANGSGNQKEE